MNGRTVYYWYQCDLRIRQLTSRHYVEMKDTLPVFKNRREVVRRCNHYPFLYTIVESGDVVDVNESKVSPKGKLSSLLNVAQSTSQIKLELQWHTGMFEFVIWTINALFHVVVVNYKINWDDRYPILRLLQQQE